ncbi:MAG: sel1 repeat family protein [Lentisphaeria bacterium]|nr:sel1 repeat family protein [Lentisphaeria bacterium]
MLKHLICGLTLSGLFLLAGCSSFERLRSAAERGVPQAQYELAEYYRSGDQALSFLWMQRAAEQGYPKAMVELGKYFLDGYGIGRNRDTALDWWRKAALEKGNLEAAQLLGELLLPDPPPGRAELAVAAYGVLLADPVCKERRKFAARLLAEGDKLRLALRLADRRDELAAVEKQFTEIFRLSSECFDLSNPKVLEQMDRLSDESYLLPPLVGKPPAPTETEGLRPEFAALLEACDRLDTDDLPKLMAEARKLPDFQEFLSTVPDLIIPMYFGKPELYGGITAGRSFYDFALFGSYMKQVREFDSFLRPFPVLASRTSVQDGEGVFLFGMPGLEPVPADRQVKYGRSELFGVRIMFTPLGDFQALRAGIEKEYGKLTPVNYTFELIRESRPYLVKITVPAYERSGGKLHVLLTDNVKPVKVELLDLIPGTPEFSHWEKYIAMNSVDGVFTWKHQNAEHYLTAGNAYERLKLKSYEKKAFIEQIEREYFPGRMLEVVDVRRNGILAGTIVEDMKKSIESILPVLRKEQTK